MLQRISATLLCLAAALALPAAAQTGAAPAFACTIPYVQPGYARKGGVAELLPGILVTCSGGTTTPAGSTVPSASIEVTLNVPITSRTEDNGAISEALLIMDDAFPASPNPSSAVRGPLSGSPQNVCPTPETGCALVSTGNASGTAGGDYDGARQHYNVFQGVPVGNNAIWFNGVPLDAPGTGTLTFRIVNLRADVSQLSSPFGLSPVQAFLQITGNQQVVMQNPSPVLAYETQGLTVQQTAPVPVPGTSDTTFSVTLTEGFANAFKTWIDFKSPGPENVPGYPYGTESGLWDGLHSSVGVQPFGLATHGTCIILHFSGYPPGTNIIAPGGVYLTGDTPTGIQPTGGIFPLATDTNGNGGTEPTPSRMPWTMVIDSHGNGWIAWEVMGSNPAVIESAKITLWVKSQATGTVTASFAPLVTEGQSPIPRFIAE